MFLKKKSKSKDLFDDYILVKRGVNRYKVELSELDKFDDDYPQKSKELNKKISDLLNIRETIEEQFLRSNGDLYVGIGYEITDLKDDPVLIPVVIADSDRAGHSSIQGTTRMGKTAYMLGTNVRQNLKARENVIVIDPKGGKEQEVFSAMVEFSYESDMLYFLKYFSLAYPELSDRMNPLFGMTHEERGTLLATIASIGNDQVFFTDVTYQMTLVTSLCFEVLEMSLDPYGVATDALIRAEQDKIAYQRQNKGFMKELISKNEGLFSPDTIDLAFSDLNKDEIDTFTTHNSTLFTFKDLAKFVTYDSIEGLQEEVFKATLSSDVDNPELIARFENLKTSAALELKKVLEQPKDFYTKISISLSTLLTQMSQGAMGEIFCGSKINPLLSDLSDPKKRLVALINPFPLRFKKISDMSSRLFLLTIENMLGRIGSTGRGFNAKVNLHVDEAASVAYPGIERLPAMAGGLGMNLYFYTQSFADWVKGLGSQEAAVVMLDNLNNQSRFRMKDKNSAERVVDELGDIDVIASSAMVESDGTNRMMMGSEKRWYGKPSDILKQPIGRIILTSGEKSYLIDTPFWSGPKGTIVMPEINVERRVKNIISYESELGALVDNMATLENPGLSRMRREHYDSAGTN
jgi:hypothetical protein